MTPVTYLDEREKVAQLRSIAARLTPRLSEAQKVAVLKVHKFILDQPIVEGRHRFTRKDIGKSPTLHRSYGAGPATKIVINSRLGIFSDKSGIVRRTHSTADAKHCKIDSPFSAEDLCFTPQQWLFLCIPRAVKVNPFLRPCPGRNQDDGDINTSHVSAGVGENERENAGADTEPSYKANGADAADCIDDKDSDDNDADNAFKVQPGTAIAEQPVVLEQVVDTALGSFGVAGVQTIAAQIEEGVQDDTAKLHDDIYDEGYIAAHELDPNLQVIAPSTPAGALARSLWPDAWEELDGYRVKCVVSPWDVLIDPDLATATYNSFHMRASERSQLMATQVDSRFERDNNQYVFANVDSDNAIPIDPRLQEASAMHISEDDDPGAISDPLYEDNEVQKFIEDPDKGAANSTFTQALSLQPGWPGDVTMVDASEVGGWLCSQDTIDQWSAAKIDTDLALEEWAEGRDEIIHFDWT